MKGLGARKTADAIATFVREHGAVGPRRVPHSSLLLVVLHLEATGISTDTT